ncbi:hypothetical protein [Nonomuraea coxensis]|uniref:hypothetical protein n=1 Tax=Nonomuraea coxensis TaxID=404386 RepID=UPI00039CDAC6|nr:hypothetical protein [Nonomuraea coxensis]
MSWGLASEGDLSRTLHDLRHGAATLTPAAHTGLKVQAMLGHAGVVLTAGAGLADSGGSLRG